MSLEAVLARVAADFPTTVQTLTDLVRIPSCSFPGFDPAHVRTSAEATAVWLKASGYPEVRLVDHPGCHHPYVIATDHRAGPTAPTLLLYAHHDVQPPLRDDLWVSPAHAPEVRDGRLWGRGAADDKAGVALHCAAAAAWNAVAGRPPINLTVLIEGEEEIGSPHFAEFLKAHRAELQADAVVIADLANVDTGLPSLTTSLRGHVALEVELAALAKPLHSGMWGGAVPDPVAALVRLLATLTDHQGRIAVDALKAGAVPLTPAEAAGLARIPYDPVKFAEQAGVLAGAAAVPADALATHRALWREPTLSIHALQAGARGKTGNVIMDRAWARLGIRIVPGQDAATVQAALIAHLKAHAPAWATLTLTPSRTGDAWATATDHPLFATAREALTLGYGTAPVDIGCGASIPFVGEFTEALGGVPALLLGVEDPICGAHAENESVHLGDLEKAIKAQAALFGLMANLR